MGRYTTIQAFADNNPTIAKVAYDDVALASSKLADEKGDFGAGVTVDKVNNVMGSTAGAGSGDFHHYRHCRRREVERIDGMERDAVREEELKEFEDRVELKRKDCEERTRKNAEKRRRKKANKAGNSGGAPAAAADEGGDDEAGGAEFTYISLSIAKSATTDNDHATSTKAVTEEVVLKAVVANDGSFLEKTKALLAKREQEGENTAVETGSS
mmetsp:Transcript_26763/g.48817  ORF Transcript_26763/g.48817 Transcript_26763/m.48817 type:complete len:213 (-) Transcript_26763:119-757(-)